MRRFPFSRLALACVVAMATAGAGAAELEGVGKDMGYRMFGEMKKNRAVLVQNSRPTAIEVLDDARGVFVPVPKFSDVEVPCRGYERVLKVRFRDSFRESVPFQVRIECGREVQFVEPDQIAPPRALARSAYSVANDESSPDTAASTP